MGRRALRVASAYPLPLREYAIDNARHRAARPRLHHFGTSRAVQEQDGACRLLVGVSVAQQTASQAAIRLDGM